MAFIDIIHRIKNNCQFLTYLNLSDLNIDDVQAKQLSRAITYNTRLKTIHAFGSRITDVGRKALAKVSTIKNVKLYFVKNFAVVDGGDVIYHIYEKN
jgi:hypothetical protein